MTTSRGDIDMEQSQRELHDLCQPLTALRCRLELSKMPGHEDTLKDAIEESLQETVRIFEVVARMRQRLLLLEQAAAQESLRGDLESLTGTEDDDSESRL